MYSITQERVQLNTVYQQTKNQNIFCYLLNDKAEILLIYLSYPHISKNLFLRTHIYNT